MLRGTPGGAVDGAHPPRDCLRPEERAPRVHVEAVVVAVERHVEQVAAPQDGHPRVVHQALDRAALAQHVVEDRLVLRDHGEVEVVSEEAAPTRGDLVAERLGMRHVGQAHRGDVEAFLGERDRDRAANAASGAGDDGRPSHAGRHDSGHGRLGEPSLPTHRAVRGRRRPRILGPRVSRIPRAQFLAHLRVGGRPEAAQVLRGLHGTAVRCEQLEDDGSALGTDTRCVCETEQLLELDGRADRPAGAIDERRGAPARQRAGGAGRPSGDADGCPTAVTPRCRCPPASWPWRRREAAHRRASGRGPQRRCARAIAGRVPCAARLARRPPGPCGHPMSGRPAAPAA